MEAPPIPAGEDNTSFKRYNQMLLLESKKTKPNMQVVCCLIERTYAFRRGDIVSSVADAVHHLNYYPFLQNADQVSCLCTYMYYVLHARYIVLWVLLLWVYFSYI